MAISDLAHTIPASALRGRLRVTDEDVTGTRVQIDDPEIGPTEVCLPTRPEVANAAAVRSTIDHVVWQTVTLDESASGCLLHATRRHRPVHVRVSLGVGLALASAGVPTLVTGVAE